MNKMLKQFLGGLIGLVAAGLTCLWLTPYFSGLREVNPVLAHFGGVTIYWYGLLIVIGIIIGLGWINRRAAGSILKDHPLNLIILAVIFGTIGARLAFVILKWSYFSGDWLKIIDLQSGGLSIHGALLGAALAMWVYARITRLPILKIFDLFVPAVLLGQIIGRVGNFFNQEAFGPPTDLPWKMFVSESFRPMGLENYGFFHPTFLYSAIGLLIILLIVLALQKHNLPDGSLFITYIISYSLLRLGIEFFRVDSDYWGSLTLAQWASLIIIIVVISLILRCRFKKR